MKKRQERGESRVCIFSHTRLMAHHSLGVMRRQKVRKLQVRIVEALKANRIGKVKSLQRILINSFSAKALAVRQVTSNKGGSTAGVDKVTWLTDVETLQCHRFFENERVQAKAAPPCLHPEGQAAARDAHHQGRAMREPCSWHWIVGNTCRTRSLWLSQIPLNGMDRITDA